MKIKVCKNFFLDILDYLFKKDIKKKMKLVNVVAVLCHGSTDKSITKREAIYVIYVDPETNLMVMKFFKVAAPAKQPRCVQLERSYLLSLLFQGMG